MSKFGAFRNQIRQKVGLEKNPDWEPKSLSERPSLAVSADTLECALDEVENDVCEDDMRSSSATSTDMEEVKSETAHQNILSCARNKFIKRGITGTITIGRVRGVSSSSISTCVTDKDVEDIDPDDLSVLDTKLISLFDQLLNSLEHAAKAWEDHPYAENTTISRGNSIGFYLPVGLALGFSIDVTFEADVSSLVKARQRRKRLKELRKSFQSIDQSLVVEVQQQGFSLVMAQKAVMATEGRGVEEALRWAVENSNREIIVSRDDTNIGPSDDV